MSTRYSLRTATVVILWLTGAATAAPADPPAQPKAEDRLDQVLLDWQRKAEARTNLDVQFTRRDQSPKSMENQDYTGRVVILPTGRALVETVRKRDGAGQTSTMELFIWTKEEMHNLKIAGNQHAHTIWPIAEKDRGRLPSALALPFLWRANPQGLKSRYKVTLLKEDAETVVLSFTDPAREDREVSSFDKAFLQLDRVTYMPRRYHVISHQSTKDYRVTKAQVNQPVDEKVFSDS